MLQNHSQKRVFFEAFLYVGGRDRVRTCNPQSRNLIFYPVELRSQFEIRFLILEFRFLSILSNLNSKIRNSIIMSIVF